MQNTHRCKRQPATNLYDKDRNATKETAALDAPEGRRNGDDASAGSAVDLERFLGQMSEAPRGDRCHGSVVRVRAFAVVATRHAAHRRIVVA